MTQENIRYDFGPESTWSTTVIVIFEKVTQIKNFLNLIIEHYPNYMRIVDQLKVVVETIEREVNLKGRNWTGFLMKLDVLL